MKGNDIKATGVKPYIVLQDSDAKRVINLSRINLKLDSTQ
jgi:hypothetical protein